MISEAFEDDTGRYTCIASNCLGADNTSAEVYIEGQIYLQRNLLEVQEYTFCLKCENVSTQSFSRAYFLQVLHHQTRTERALCLTWDQEPCRSMCVSEFTYELSEPVTPEQDHWDLELPLRSVVFNWALKRLLKNPNTHQRPGHTPNTRCRRSGWKVQPGLSLFFKLLKKSYR